MNTAPGVYVGNSAVMLCNVGDSMLFAADEHSLDNSYHELGKRFRVKNLGKLNRFLRLDLTCSDNCSVRYSQEQLINKFLQDTSME